MSHQDSFDLPRFRAVSLGGGTGQPTLLRALRRLPCDIDAVVAMADDGRSTGILRDVEGILPPGDLRKCLVALASPERTLLARSLEHRFEWLDRHTLGNLLITSLVDEGASFTEALQLIEDLLGCVGRVHPCTLDTVSVRGRTAAGEVVSGQARLSYESGRVVDVWQEPADALAYGPAVDAIGSADMVVLGPGSLFTSIVPNLLVPGIASAVRASSAVKVFVCPKADVPGETEGMSALDFADALERLGVWDMVDVMLVHRAGPGHGPVAPSPYPDVAADDADLELIASRGVDVRARDMSDPGRPTAHEVTKLADCLAEVARDVL